MAVALVAVAAALVVAVPGSAMPTAGVSFLAMRHTNTSSIITGDPPDPTGAVGPNHYVEAVNSGIEVFNKSGGVAAAAKSLNALWTGYVGTNSGNGCATRNDGDPVVRYDRLARVPDAVRLQPVLRSVQPARSVDAPHRLDDSREQRAVRADGGDGLELHPCLLQLRGAQLHPAAGQHDEDRWARRPPHGSPRVSQLRDARVALREPHGDRRSRRGHSLVRDPQPRHDADHLPTGELRAGRQ